MIANNDGVASFVYNSKNQLFSITNDGYYNGLDPSLIEYDYDAVGNRTTRYTQATWTGCYRDQILGEVYSYDTETNRLSGTTFEDCQYDYDGNGNLIGMTGCNAELDEGTNSWNMVYDSENRLKEITVANYCSGNFTETYSYDPLGRRTGKAQGTSHTSYIYGLDDQPLSVIFDADTDVANDEATTHYYYAQGRLLAKEQEGVMYYVHQDRLMSNRVETNSDGDIHAEMLATPFGHQLINDGIRMSFATGKELDDTGLYYFGDRFYDPSLGRFTSPDQLAEGRPFDSAYVYVGNNPMNRVDPDGTGGSGNGGCECGGRLWRASGDELLQQSRRQLE